MVLTRVTSPYPQGGALTFRESPNYEMPADADGDNVYEVTVAATDADSNRGEKSVEVKVANVDEDGTVTLSAVQPRVGVSLTASLTDPDGGVSDLKWQWSNGNNDDIDGATSDTYTPVADDAEATLTVRRATPTLRVRRRRQTVYGKCCRGGGHQEQSAGVR